MSPTVFRHRGYRFFFFSREEARVHVHVASARGEAKFWLTPKVAMAANHGLSEKQVVALTKLVEEHRDEIQNAWNAHFRS